MPTFDTPEPITATLEFEMGTARITAGKRLDTVVEVIPTVATEEADVRVAQQTTVTYEGGRLLVKGPKRRTLFGRPGSVDISVELPAGSEVLGTSQLAGFTCKGPLGEVRLKTSLGDIRVAEAASARLKTDHGDIQLDSVTGDAEVTGSGHVEVARVGGEATVKNTNGETSIGEIHGALTATASNGRITIGVAHAGIEAQTANGAIRIREVARGRVTLLTSAGDIEVGIRESTAAWLDVHTKVGSVRNSIGPSEAPGAEEESVSVRARTSVGDITIRRA
ncbi:DUF4097 family beta strand repeat-containing protein [Kitasatospora sp. NPDC052868]|uniref:DUF4097 family beta strand repeat-containing protein n=1 Tax=Kitasatospora sp. NPDC052868 TaxID=3364060 RepID=UPI0037C75A5E